MANRTSGDKNVKVRILLIERMLSKDRYITAKQIVSRLETQHEIYVEKKTVYDDLMAIDRLIPLEAKSGHNGGYRIMTFE